MKKALLVGANGLVGSNCLMELLDDPFYEKVEIWVRNSMKLSHPKLIEKIVDFDNLESIQSEEINHVYCCLGTTIKKAGSQEAFIKVDYTYVVELAKFCEKISVEKLLVVSSIGAKEKSSNFYLKTKGRMEEAIKLYNIPGIYIFQPSFLLGKRNETRIGESIGKVLINASGVFMFGKLAKYKGIEAKTVAKSMIHFAKSSSNGIQIIESDQIKNSLK
ncbi:MAG: NAD(P)H-binding protein [Bacteroidetes bacterium]|nr:NAD(P)H-binding protein [Bacteroidota bacterium]